MAARCSSSNRISSGISSGTGPARGNSGSTIESRSPPFNRWPAFSDFPCTVTPPASMARRTSERLNSGNCRAKNTSSRHPACSASTTRTNGGESDMTELKRHFDAPAGGCGRLGGIGRRSFRFVAGRRSQIGLWTFRARLSCRRVGRRLLASGHRRSAGLGRIKCRGQFQIAPRCAGSDRSNNGFCPGVPGSFSGAGGRGSCLANQS